MLDKYGKRGGNEDAFLFDLSPSSQHCGFQNPPLQIQDNYVRLSLLLLSCVGTAFEKFYCSPIGGFDIVFSPCDRRTLSSIITDLF